MHAEGHRFDSDSLHKTIKAVNRRFTGNGIREKYPVCKDKQEQAGESGKHTFYESEKCASPVKIPDNVL